MAYVKTVWTDRIVERPMTYTETVNSDGSKTFTPAPGEVTEVGTPITASRMNNLEDGVAVNTIDIDTLKTLVSQLACPYGIGDYLVTESTQHPSDRWLGTMWQKVSGGTFLMAAGDGYNAGTTGGEAQHVLTVNEMPRHSHQIGIRNGGSTPIPQWTPIIGDYAQTNVTGGFLSIPEAGGGQAHNNLPPYKAVHIYKRIG